MGALFLGAWHLLWEMKRRARERHRVLGCEDICEGPVTAPRGRYLTLKSVLEPRVYRSEAPPTKPRSRPHDRPYPPRGSLDPTYPAPERYGPAPPRGTKPTQLRPWPQVTAHFFRPAPPLQPRPSSPRPVTSRTRLAHRPHLLPPPQVAPRLTSSNRLLTRTPSFPAPRGRRPPGPRFGHSSSTSSSS